MNVQEEHAMNENLDIVAFPYQITDNVSQITLRTMMMTLEAGAAEVVTKIQFVTMLAIYL